MATRFVVNFPSLLLTVACCLLVNASAGAQEPATPPRETTTLETVLVTGEQPGPGLWKVSKGDHVLWILGAQYPLPKKMVWHAREVEQTIAQSQAVLADASARLDIGFFRALTLVPAVLGARKNADGATLKDILPADLYARWLTLKAKYIGHDRGVERLRPMLAANELYDKALDRSGLARNREIWNTVEKTARRAHVRIIEPEVRIAVDDPKQALQDFRSTAGKLDVDCLEATIRRLETDLDAMRLRANAWAVGDIDALRRLPYPDQRETCKAALESNVELRQRMGAALTEIDAAWISAAEKALDQNTTTFAVLPMNELLQPDRRLAMLAARGYTVEPPE
ncbi:MAG TPA: TraB/GumN family protein [Rudaea sp.]|nr:TraB/GumN family protein [Rudaea sp.]